jgi:hypothetical protein
MASRVLNLHTTSPKNKRREAVSNKFNSSLHDDRQNNAARNDIDGCIKARKADRPSH